MLMNAKNKKKKEKIALSHIDVYKIYIFLVFLIVKRSMFFKTKLRSHFLQPKTVKSIK